tara:strand:- start:185 stop:1213 length:1029 start_codon:yes stop_codon:yes gene_type:complete
MVEFLNRYVSIEKESTYGTEPSGSPIYGEVDDESLMTTYDLMTRQDMSRPIASKSVTGTERSEGDINLAIQVDDFVGNLLFSFFPQDTASNPSGSIYKHVMTEPSLTSPSAGVYPSWTVRVGREEKEHTFTGMMTNSLNISATVGEYAMMSVGFVGQRESDTAALATPTFDGAALDALYFANGVLNFDDGSTTGAAVATVKSFSFDINLNRDTDNAYGIGNSTYIRAPPAQRREVTGTIEFNKVIYTSSAAEPTYDDLINEDGLAYNDGAAPVLSLYLKDEAAADFILFQFENIRFEAPEASVSGRDTNTMTVNFVALYDDNRGCMTVTAEGLQLSSTQYDA